MVYTANILVASRFEEQIGDTECNTIKGSSIELLGTMNTVYVRTHTDKGNFLFC